jgi:peptidoglycan hydrolase-like protein with peptidoglycan-binding domain
MNIASVHQRSPKAASAVPRSVARGSMPAISPQSYPVPTIARCACGGNCPRCKAQTFSQPKLKINAPNVAPSNHSLQRKCSCGGTPGPSGECEECRRKKRLGLQAKLDINEPGDIYEQEADRIADQVMATTAHSGVSGARPRIQRVSGHSNAKMDAAPANVDQTLANSGRPLDLELRQDMEQRFGYDFSKVRIHSDAVAGQSAREVNARAYTVGSDIVFDPDQFNPATISGRKLLAHELVHTIQQSATGLEKGPSAGSAVDLDHRAERLQRQVSPAFSHLQSPRFSPSAKLERCFEDTDRLRQGDPDTDAVIRIQQALIDVQKITGNTYDLGSTGPNNDGVDGDYGPKTVAAVKKFKADEKLGFTEFGDVGPGTMHRLDELFSAEAEQPEQPPLLKPRPGEEPSVIELPGGLQILVPGTSGVPSEIPEPGVTPEIGGLPNVFGFPGEKGKGPVRIVPSDPRNPLDLRNFKCETKRVLKVEIFTGAMSDLIARQILTARLLLSQHNMDLEATIKPISSPAFPLGFDVNIPSLGDGEVQHHIDLCELIGKTIKDVGHQSGFMPVFFIPVGIFVMGSGDDGAVAFFARDADSLVCKLGGGSTGLKSLIVMNVRADLCDTVLLHEIGHAAGNSHAGGTVLDGAGCAGKNRNVILHDQVRRFCNASFP